MPYFDEKVSETLRAIRQEAETEIDHFQSINFWKSNLNALFWREKLRARDSKKIFRKAEMETALSHN